MSYGKTSKFIRISNAVAAGLTDSTSSTFDVSGADAVKVIAAFGALTATAVTAIRVRHGDESDGSDAADITGATLSIADDDDNQIGIVTVEKPTKRYFTVVIDRATANAVIDGVFAELCGYHKQPVTHDSSTVVGETVVAG
jgi:hypothetical protein